MKYLARVILIGMAFLPLVHRLSAQSDSLFVSQNEVVPFAEQMPEFPGGPAKLYEYIFKEIKYPLKCVNKGISGIVVVKFIVDMQGKLQNIHVVQSVAPELDAEAIRVVESMNHMKAKWEPGRSEGKAVNVEFILPIKFVLQ